jgi:hypothetical protein
MDEALALLATDQVFDLLFTDLGLSGHHQAGLALAVEAAFPSCFRIAAARIYARRHFQAIGRNVGPPQHEYEPRGCFLTRTDRYRTGKEDTAQRACRGIDRQKGSHNLSSANTALNPVLSPHSTRATKRRAVVAADDASNCLIPLKVQSAAQA